MLYFTSDLHLGHLRALEIMSHRPWDTLDDMNRGLIAKYNSVITDQDTVVFLGDLIMGPKKVNVPLFLPQLKGTKILVCGNHDWLPSEVNEKKLKDMEQLYKDNGVSEVYYGVVNLSAFTRDDNDRKVKLCHFPTAATVDDRDNEHEQRYTYLRPEILEDEYLLHGHTHARDSKPSKNLLHVGVDAEAWGYKPVSLDTVRHLLGL